MIVRRWESRTESLIQAPLLLPREEGFLGSRGFGINAGFKLHARWVVSLCILMNCSLPGSSVHGIFQVRILEGVAISSSRRSSWSRDWTRISCFGKWILYHWTTWKAWNKVDVVLNQGSYIYCHTVWGKWLTSVLQFSPERIEKRLLIF